MIRQILLLLLVFSSFLMAKDQLSIENEFVKIVVNNDDAKGRFALQTTAGDPTHKRDDYQDLIYGKPIPWTSYTTLLIDGKPFVFGSEGKRLGRRTQKTFAYLPIKKQKVEGDSIVSVASYGDLDIEQRLSFYRNPNTLVNDSMKIEYTVLNNAESNQEVGLRILLDTKLGENDGAPLRMGEDTVPTEIKYEKEQLVPYWQTFDSIGSPNVVAQGLLSDFKGELTKPDLIYLANWGTLVDSEWNIQYEEGRSFIRTGEKQKDTALALYYNAQVISPNASVTLSTVYGLGGVSLAPGVLSAGLAAPKQVPGNSQEPFLVVGYLLNSSGFDSVDTVAEFEIPNDFMVVQGDLVTTYNTLSAGSQRQVSLLLKPLSAEPRKLPISFSVSSSTFEKNSIKRYVDILGRPSMQVFSVKPSLSNYKGSHVVVEGVIRNPSPLPISDLSIQLTAAKAVDFAPFEQQTKRLSVLQPYEALPFSWAFKVKDGQELSAVHFTLKSEQTGVLQRQSAISLMGNKSSYLSVLADKDFAKDDYVTAQLQLPVSDSSYALTFDNDVLSLVRSSSKEGVSIHVNEDEIRIDVSADADNQNEQLFLIHFKKNKDDLSQLVLRQNEKQLSSIDVR